MDDIYRSAGGRRLIHDLYRRHLAALDVPFSERMVATELGDTHVMAYGQRDATPILCFHGEYLTNPLAMRPFIEGLDLERVRLVVPDVPGAVGFSPGRRLSVSKGEYGRWALQVMEELGMRGGTVLAWAQGARIALQLCETAVLSVSRLMLVQPAGFAATSLARTDRLLGGRTPDLDRPQLSDQTVRRAMEPALNFDNPDLLEMARQIYLYLRPEPEEWREVKKKNLDKFRAPVGIVACKSDCLYPGEDVVKQARRVVPFIEMSRVVDLGCHCGLFADTDAARETIGVISDFLLRSAD